MNEPMDPGDLLPDDLESTTGIVKNAKESEEKLSKQVEDKARKLSQKMRALRNRLVNTEYRYVNRSRRSRPG